MFQMFELKRNRFTKEKPMNNRQDVSRCLGVLTIALFFAGINAASSQEECDWCGAADAPRNLSWSTVIAGPDEPGEPLIITGVVYQPDGRTPAKDILIYVYHTNAKGYYRTAPDQHRHGKLRGWMRTNAEGRYEFRTIKPGAYPSRTDPAHIHITLSGDGYSEYWIDSFWFEGDPLITEERQAKLSGRGGYSPIISLEKDRDGVWRGVRNIKLEKVE
jgi:protocatechuate 3,4-dioxygenase beta subunit